MYTLCIAMCLPMYAYDISSETAGAFLTLSKR